MGLLRYIASQIEVTTNNFESYADRDETRREGFRQRRCRQTQSDGLRCPDLIRDYLTWFADFFSHRNPSPSAVGTYLSPPLPRCPWVGKRSTPRITVNQVDGIPDPPKPATPWYPVKWAKARNYLWKSADEGGFRRIC